MRHDRDLDAVDPRDPAGSKHLPRRAVDEDAALVHQGDLVAVFRGQVEVVEDGEGGQVARSDHAQRQIENGELVREIEV